LFEVALSGLAASSKTLLRAPFYLAAFMALITVLTAVGLLWALVEEVPVWPWILALLIEFNSTWLFLFLGVMGEQIRLISERTRNVPLVIERERVNF
jgi:hypothetical protein